MARELTQEDVVWTCPEDWVTWSSIDEVPPASTIVGQDRAVDAIAFGLAVPSIGYNVFVTGLSGTGRLTTITSFLDQLADAEQPVDDVCYVYNFRNPEEPCGLFLKAGAGRRLVAAMERLIRELSENVPKVLNDKDFRKRLERAVADLQRQERQLVESFEEEVKEAGFVLVQIQAGPVTRPEILPVVNGKPAAMEEIPALVESGAVTEEQQAKIADTHRQLSERLREAFHAVADLRREAAARTEDVRRRLLEPTFAEVVNQVRAKVDDDRVDPYLDAVREDLKENLEIFTTSGDEGEDRFMRWRVNLAVDNADLKGRPVILETEPNYSNLFGTIERALTPTGEVLTSFMRIRAGSLLRANGGFLVINIQDALLDPRVWPALKRALKFRRVQIQTLESLMLGAAALKPEPVPLDVKVVVIGDRYIYDVLHRYDSDFSKVFKVLADFDSVMPTDENRSFDVLSVLRKVTDEEKLLPLDRSGMAAMLEESVRLGRSQRKFSSRFSDISDLLRESAYIAGREELDHVSRDHVRAARVAYRRRHGLTEDRMHDLINDGIIRIVTGGTAPGQVNGLAVYDLGHHRFGKPSRITARVGVGREGIINVERQAGLSGPTHDKGVNILTGFLRGTFARKVPLTLACSVTFEQSYGGIDGDSASSTEIYAILSALSGVEIRQDIAVTGSVDQYGTIQAIGGVNEKVEGFYRVCLSRGLTGSQGVMVPESNVPDLHLDPEVVDAVRDGRFHVWSVSTIDEGIELLTGRPAGAWSDEEGWSEDSIYAACQERLDDMVRLIRQAGKTPGKPEDAEPDDIANGGLVEDTPGEDDPKEKE